MTDLLLAKKERDLLFSRIENMQKELNIANENSDYYRRELFKTRALMIDIYNLSGAKTEVPDSETQDESWIRLAESIKEAIT